MITFNIVAPPSSNIVFDDSTATAAMGVTRSAGTKPPPGATDPQIPAYTILNNGKQLVVANWNSDPTTLYYSLYFKNFNHPLDPIMDNGGGHTAYQSSASRLLCCCRSYVPPGGVTP